MDVCLSFLSVLSKISKILMCGEVVRRNGPSVFLVIYLRGKLVAMHLYIHIFIYYDRRLQSNPVINLGVTIILWKTNIYRIMLNILHFLSPSVSHSLSKKTRVYFHNIFCRNLLEIIVPSFLFFL